MKGLKTVLSFLLVFAVLLSAAVFVRAEENDEEDDGTETFYFDGDVEVTFEPNPYESEEGKELDVYIARESVEEMLEYINEGIYYVPYEVESLPGGIHMHRFSVSTITAVKHYAFDDPPRCLECIYKLYVCKVEGCGYKYTELNSVKRIACHSDVIVYDWEERDNYLFYNNSDGHKNEGYLTDSVRFKLKEQLYADKIDESIFPPIKDSIRSFVFDPSDRSVVLTFSDPPGNGNGTVYTNSEVDDHIARLKYLSAVPYVYDLEPSFRHDDSIEYIPAEEETGTNITEPETEAGIAPQNPQTPSAEVTETGGNDDFRTPDDSAPGNVPQGNRPLNPNTGDEVVLYIALAAVSITALLFVLAVKKRHGKFKL